MGQVGPGPRWTRIAGPPLTSRMTTPQRRGFNNAITGLWSFLAPVYDQPALQRWVYRPPHDEVIARLRAHQSRKIADIACGTGLLSDRIERELHPEAIYGVDMSAGMLAQARARSERVQWIRGQAEQLPFDDGCLDGRDDFGIPFLRPAGRAAGVPSGTGAGWAGGGLRVEYATNAAASAVDEQMETSAQRLARRGAVDLRGCRVHRHRSAPDPAGVLDPIRIRRDNRRRQELSAGSISTAGDRHPIRSSSSRRTDSRSPPHGPHWSATWSSATTGPRCARSSAPRT